jgi:hypothetical protein
MSTQVWRTGNGERPGERYVQSFGGESIMVWAGMSSDAATELVILGKAEAI